LALRSGKARVPTEQEQRRLFTVAQHGRHGRRDHALVQTSYRLGLRAKELAGLRVGDVFDGTRLRDDLVLSARVTKGGRPRTLYLTNGALRAVLLAYLEERKRGAAECLNPALPLFMSQQGGAFSPNTMQQLFRRLYVAAGIDGARSHSGRRYFATELLGKGVDIKSVSVLMGHSSVAMTARYADDNPQKLRRILAELI
jgi:integrase/recombinase XerD